jgi:hypothetical protein
MVYHGGAKIGLLHKKVFVGQKLFCEVRALHERLLKATITMQGETRVPIAIGRGGQSELR